MTLNHNRVRSKWLYEYLCRVAKFDEHFRTSDMHLQKDKCTFSKGILSVKLQYLVNIKIKINICLIGLFLCKLLICVVRYVYACIVCNIYSTVFGV